jgi:cytochrome P450
MPWTDGFVKTMAGTWSCILALALHPEVQQKGRVIIDARLEGRLPDFSDFGTLPYVDAIVNESLRWNPVTPLGVPHCARQDDYYEGHFIKKGTMVFGNIWALLRDEMTYGKDTDKFIPERWLTQDGTFNPDMDTDAAFGFGRRICPGKGDITSQSIFSKVLTHLQISPGR